MNVGAGARSAAICCVVVVLVVACSPPAAGPPGPAPAPPPGRAAAGPVLRPAAAWGPCAGYADTPEDRIAYADERFECARLQVPLDYAAPDGPAARSGSCASAAAGERVGSLVVNPGGPGASGMELVPAAGRALADS